MKKIMEKIIEKIKAFIIIVVVIAIGFLIVSSLLYLKEILFNWYG
jgi:hypothetical protein